MLDEAPPQVATHQHVGARGCIDGWVPGHEGVDVETKAIGHRGTVVARNRAAVLAHADEDDANEVDVDEVDSDEVDDEVVDSDEVEASDVTSDEMDETVEESDADDVDATNSLVELLEVVLDGSKIAEEVLEVGSVVVEEMLLLAIEAVVKLAEPVDVLIGTKLE
ncbi:hypothetical protein LTR22_000153 [Elasticomyces elasticus]|nr:hypothetical protein LTR22_000153 [Elasticomyces elasticus]KAK4920955.1 hypothetical protein LTR49_011499 [Elasticomyces elasticus]